MGSIPISSDIFIFMINRAYITLFFIIVILISKELVILNEEFLVAICFFSMVLLIYQYGRDTIASFLEERSITILKDLKSCEESLQSFDSLTLKTLYGYEGIANNIEVAKEYCYALSENSITSGLDFSRDYINIEIENIFDNLYKVYQLEKFKIFKMIYFALRNISLLKLSTRIGKKSQKKDDVYNRFLLKVKSL